MGKETIGLGLKSIFVLVILRKVVPVLGSLLFLLYIAYLGWLVLAPEKPIPDAARQKAVNAAVEKAVEEIRDKRGNIRSAVMIHFYNDPTDYISDTMRDALNANGVLSLASTTFCERLYKHLQLRPEGVKNFEEASKFGEDYDVDGILWGRIDLFESSDHGVQFTGKWYLMDKETGDVVINGSFSEDSRPLVDESGNITVNGEKIANPATYAAVRIPWYLRFLGFLLVVLMLPVITISFIRTMVAKKSNKVNAFVLAIYTIVGIICAFFMIGGTFASGWTVVLFIAACLSSLLYNTLLMNFALKLES